MTLKNLIYTPGRFITIINHWLNGMHKSRKEQKRKINIFHFFYFILLTEKKTLHLFSTF